MTPSPMNLRALQSADFDLVSPVADEWWGGRPVRHLLPRLFFEHFGSTSFAIVEGEQLRAFLIGFRSQTMPHVAYIHFVGVSPGSRQHGLGRRLYGQFFERVGAMGCTEVHCITSPVNIASIAFHRRMGFELIEAGGEVNGVPVKLDHGGPGQHKVLFRKLLAAATA